MGALALVTMLLWGVQPCASMQQHSLFTYAATEMTESVPVQVADPNVSCEAWGNWIVAGSYCLEESGGRCLFHTRGRRLEDVYRQRNCRHAITFAEWTEAEFDTWGAGCCGDPLWLWLLDRLLPPLPR